ncbi:MAG: glycoside hydrolase family 6 protein [Herminiimonas sp.]|nr:glycoside hydrolase family 6 protein [Herminiimonas sp.]
MFALIYQEQYACLKKRGSIDLSPSVSASFVRHARCFRETADYHEAISKTFVRGFFMALQALQTWQTNPGTSFAGSNTADTSWQNPKKQAALEAISSTFNVSATDLKSGVDRLEKANKSTWRDSDEVSAAINDIVSALTNPVNTVLPPQQMQPVCDAQGAGQDAGSNVIGRNQKTGQRSGMAPASTIAPGPQSPVGFASADSLDSYDPANNDLVSGNADPQSQLMETLRYLLQTLGIPSADIDKVLSLLLQEPQQSDASRESADTGSDTDDGQYAMDAGQYANYGSPVSYQPPSAQTPWQAQWQPNGSSGAEATNAGGGASFASSGVSEPQSFASMKNLSQFDGASQSAALQGSADTFVFRDQALDAEIARRETTDPAGAQALRELAATPVAKWVNGDPNDGQAIQQYMDGAEAAGKKGLIAMYDIPGRDMGNYSAGGASGNGDYLAKVDAVAKGIGNRKADVILEPDALMDSTRMGPEVGSARRQLMSQAVDRLTAQPNTTVSIAAGSPGYASPSQVADLLIESGIGKARNFSVGESGFIAPEKLMAYGDSIVSELAKRGVTGVHYSVETARNGVETHGEGSAAWAEADGAASGIRPTSDQAIIKNPNVSSFNWVKVPWQADGRIAAAGSTIPDYAISLVRNAHANGVW